ncbi:MAG: aspartyl/asparaginyl beta-hydroxylase domain-containing protein [Moorea sp. SIO1F2]|uniref:aspartyl/asparaginyl beta-hydroxylase domain-containing protein n=1 Tax=unclassified Moorena TaxID=2683338 RepID=UPI0013B8CCAF|nr:MULTISPECIES: aspartyl/asparaginyl beta-hydroxylase domain-containing protein [unclassified Moorena]NEO04187.1 aspartyl/asparaginyl beta-hydroxylase domain-containing protein [Moorena sp. SIO3I8]NEO21807.1 aspartyl/asparaginyl beta-hydroxylase domain-containing protein [Moorena sp. SIO4A5]NEQ57920.1 aspartyl/asparaginyl beta-hydroxylase domain-containing protein [Moorena sp. SIO4A1]NET81448.1 aspartyl/asparaginyl beta-hydroxylase domain-containing protein [Moorena sp. SIO1F2]
MNLKRLYCIIKNRLVTYKIVAIFNPIFNIFIGGNHRPVFFNIEEDYPTLKIFEQHYAVIKAELEAVLVHQDRMPRYHEIDDDLLYASGRYNRDKRWNIYMLFCYGEKPQFNRELCPETCALLDSIPNLCQGFFSILDPGKSIPLHTSPSRYYLRYHLGLKVPKHNPPILKIKDCEYSWKEGEGVLFDDSWEHEIINNADELRAVLIVDVLRPMALPVHVLGKFIMFLARWIYALETHRRIRRFFWTESVGESAAAP